MVASPSSEGLTDLHDMTRMESAIASLRQLCFEHRPALVTACHHIQTCWARFLISFAKVRSGHGVKGHYFDSQKSDDVFWCIGELPMPMSTVRQLCAQERWCPIAGRFRLSMKRFWAALGKSLKVR